MIWLYLIVIIPYLGVIWCLLMIYRTHCVYKWRMQILDESLEDYNPLPPYEVMVRRFWIWDARKFLSKGDK